VSVLVIAEGAKVVPSAACAVLLALLLLLHM